MQLPGISTGIDTSSIVQQLMAVSKQRLYSYKIQKLKYEDRNTALDELRAKLKAFDSSLSALSDSETLTTFKATSTDTDILSATAASTGVFEGTHEIEVNQLANSERWVHSGFLFEESLVGSGSFIYSYNHEEIVIDTDAATTLEDLAGLINNDNDNPGVTATVLEYDNGNDGVYHLMLSGNDAGSDYQITVNSSTTQVLAADAILEKDSEEASLSTKLIDLDQFSGTLLGSEKIAITGTDQSGAAITQKDLDITEEMTVGHLIDRINDAFDGIAKAKFEDGKITLTDDVSGASLTSMSLSLTGAGGGDPASLALPTFSDASADGGTEGGLLPDSNALLLNGGSFTRTQAAQNSQIRVNGYPANEIQTLSSMTGSPNHGTFTLTYGGEVTDDINYNATAQEIQDALELLSTVNSGDITVAGTLDAGDVTFTFASSIDDPSMISVDPGNTGETFSVEETAKGYISRSSNSLTNVLPGVSMELYDVGTVQISLNKDTNSIKSKLKGLITNYNSTVSFIKTKTAYDEETKAAGVLITSYTTRVIQNIMRTGIRTPATGFTEGEEEYLYAWEIGLDFSSKQGELGMLVLDEGKLDEAIENNYEAVAALIGANDTGRSSGANNDIINFSASTQFTESGEYEVEVDTDGSGEILEVRVKHSSETEWRSLAADSWNENGLVTIDGESDVDGEWYPERDLQLSIDTSALGNSQTYSATIHVQQGIAGVLKDRLEDILDTKIGENEAPTGYLAIDVESGKKAMTALDDRIAQEEKRLERKEDRLTAQYARLEKTMTILQQQFSAISMLQTQG